MSVPYSRTSGAPVAFRASSSVSNDSLVHPVLALLQGLSAPLHPGALTRVRAILLLLLCAGALCSFAQTSAWAVPAAPPVLPYGWGFNFRGQLGNNNNSSYSNVPDAVSTTGVLNGKTIKQVAGGSDYSLAVDSEGKAYAWGDNSSGQLGNGTTTYSLVPVAVSTTGVLNGKTIIQVAGGYYHSLALDSDGKVYAWGSNSSGQLGNGTTAQSLVPVAVSTSGVLNGKTIIQIAAGQNHSLALASDGKVYAWGNGYNGQLGNGIAAQSLVPVAVSTSGVLNGKTIIQIAALIGDHSLALDSDGKVYAWGRNSDGQLGNGTTTQSLVPVAVSIPSGKTIKQVAAASYDSLALDSDGNVYAWGNNGFGQLGINSTTNSSVPVAVDTSGVLNGKTITQVTAGADHSLALDSDGKAYAWGRNGVGSLGNGTTTQSLVPVAVTTSGALSGKAITQISAGRLHSLALAISSNSAPVISNVKLSPGTAMTNSTLTAQVSASDAQNDQLTYKYVWMKDTVVISGESGNTLDLSKSGNGERGEAITVTVTANDGSLDSTSVTSDPLVIANSAPTANDDSATVAEDSGATTLDVLANDSSAPDSGETLSVLGVTQPGSGTASLVNGVVRYTPATNFYGSTFFTYTLSDSNGGTATGTVTVTVTPVNDAPLAKNDSYNTAFGTQLNVAPATGVLSNDSDVESNPLSVADHNPATPAIDPVSGPSHGTLVLLADGSFTYTPASLFVGDDSFTYKATDGQNANSLSNVATVTIHVAANVPPVAMDDSATTAEDTSVTINVLSNDTDVDGGTLMVADSITGVKGGSVQVQPDGTVLFTPSANANGSNTTGGFGFTYKVSDGTSTSLNSASVSITVTPANDNPTATDDTATVAEDSSATVVDVLANDSSAPDAGETLSVTEVTQPAHGAVTLTNGVVSYKPAANYNGSDSFTYTLSDGNDGTATATVTVTVTPTNDNPTATDDTATVAEDSSATAINVLGNDSSAPDSGETLSVTKVTQGAHGTVTLTNGVVSYKPAANYNGSDSFTYTLSDGNGGTATGTVTVTVTPVNDNPTATDDTATVSEDSSATVVDVLTNDSSAPDSGETLSVTKVTQPAHGAVTLTAGVVSYKPDANYSGSDSFTYTLSDGNGGTATGTVTVTVTSVNDAPTATDDSATIAEDSSATVVDVLANDSSAPDSGETLSVSAVTQGAHGTVTLTNGVVSYKPAANYNGSDSFTYTLSDGNRGTATGTVIVTVTPVNDAPLAKDDSYNTAFGVKLSVDAAHSVLSNDSDMESNPLSVADHNPATPAIDPVNAPSHGTLALQADGSFTYTPASLFVGDDSFTYKATDGQSQNSLSNVATVTIHVAANVPPVAVDDSATTAEDTSVTINVVSNDTDADGGTLMVAANSISTVKGGTAQLQNDGKTVRFTPSADANGSNTTGGFGFTYKVSDGTSTSLNSASVSITVTPVNDAPVVSSVTIAPSAPKTNDTLTAQVSASDVESATSSLSYKFVWKKGTAVIAGESAKTLDLSKSGRGDQGETISVTVTANDGTTDSVPLTSAPVTVGNSAPSLSSVTIAPLSPTTKTTLTAIVKASDDDQDSLSHKYVWKKGSAVIVGESGSSLDLSKAGNGDKGESITVTVVANDGTTDSAPLTSAPVTIGNTAPALSSVVLSPSAPKTDDLLQATVVGADDDGDTLSYKFVWKKGSAVIAGESGSSLDLSKAGNGDDGDSITVTVIAHDGSADSLPLTSSAVSISNRLPKVESVSPQGVSDVVGAKRQFSVSVSDGNGVRDIASAWLLINTQLDWGQGATLKYVPTASSPTNGLLYLRRGDAWLAPVQVGRGASASEVVDNGAVRVAGSDVSVSLGADGNTLMLSVLATVREGLVGQNALFGRVEDMARAVDARSLPGEFGYIRSGNYTVTTQFGGPNVAPTLSALTPATTNTQLTAAGVAPGVQTFGFFFKDDNGTSDLESVWFLAGAKRDWSHSATLVYMPRTRRLYLRSDDGTTLLGGGQIGSAGILENSQVRVDLSKVIVRIYSDGKSQGLSLPLQAKSGLLGTNKVWLRVRDNAGLTAPNGDDLGFVQSGTWNVKAAPTTTPTPTATPTTSPSAPTS